MKKFFIFIFISALLLMITACDVTNYSDSFSKLDYRHDSAYWSLMYGKFKDEIIELKERTKDISIDSNPATVNMISNFESELKSRMKTDLGIKAVDCSVNYLQKICEYGVYSKKAERASNKLNKITAELCYRSDIIYDRDYPNLEDVLNKYPFKDLQLFRNLKENYNFEKTFNLFKEAEANNLGSVNEISGNELLFLFKSNEQNKEKFKKHGIKYINLGDTNALKLIGNSCSNNKYSSTYIYVAFDKNGDINSIKYSRDDGINLGLSKDGYFDKSSADSNLIKLILPETK